MTIFLTLEVILCLSSNVFWEKLKLFMTLSVPSGKPWVFSKRFFFTRSSRWISQDEIHLVFFVDYGTSETSWGVWEWMGCMYDISVYIPPEEEALSLCSQASSIKGMNW